MRKSIFSTSMKESEIYRAALKEDEIALKEILKIIGVDRRMVRFHLTPVAELLAKEGDFIAADFLIKYGAFIPLIAQAAASSGYRDYSEKFLREFKNSGLFYSEILKHIAYGAASCDNHEHAEALLGKGASIDSLVIGAVFGKQYTYIHELRVRGAHINCVANAAAFTGNYYLAEKSLREGADLNYVGLGALDGHKHEYLQELLQRYLARFQFNNYQEYFQQTQHDQSDFRIRCHPDKFTKTVIARAINIRSLKAEFNLNQQEAFTVADKRNFGAIVYLMAMSTIANSKLNLKTKLPKEVLIFIFSFIFGFDNNPCFLKKIGFGLFLSRIAPKRKLLSAMENALTPSVGM